MDDKWLQAMIATATSLAGLALVSVLVSKNAQTASVVSAVAGGYAQVLQAAVSPLTASTTQGNGQ